MFYDRSDLIQRAIHTVEHNLVEGALLVVVILLLMLGNIRAGLIVAAVIPLSMMIAFAGMRAFGISGNLMSLGAIDFGLIVDGAVVLVENVLRRQSDGERRRRDPVQVVPRAAAEVARPVMFSVVIIALVYLPVLSLQDIEGKTFRPMALTVMMALAGALLVTMLVVPALCRHVPEPQAGRSATPSSCAGRARGYTPVLRARPDAIPGSPCGVAAGLFAGAVFLPTKLGGEFIPQLSEGAIVVTSTSCRASTSMPRSARSTEIEKVLRGFPDVATVVSQTGSAAMPTDPMGVQSTDSYVDPEAAGAMDDGRHPAGHPRRRWRRSSKAAVPGVAFEFSQPIQMRMDDLLQGVRSDVALPIYGEDLATLQRPRRPGRAGREIRQGRRRRACGAAGRPAGADRAGRPREAGALRAQCVRCAGRGAGDRRARRRAWSMATDDTETPIVVRLAPELRTERAGGSATCRSALPGGSAVPLSAVADIAVADGPAADHARQAEAPGRRRHQRRRPRRAELRHRGAEGGRATSVKLPPGYTLEWSGKFQNLQSATARLALVVPAVLAADLPAALPQFRQPAAGGADLPERADGGDRRDRGAGAARHAVQRDRGHRLHLDVRHRHPRWRRARQLHRGGRAEGRDPAEAARDAAEKRLRPVLTTALVASIGFVPMAVSTSAGAEVQRPLATVVIGGLITATLLTLLVLPSLYPVVMEASWASVRRRFTRRHAGAAPVQAAKKKELAS